MAIYDVRDFVVEVVSLYDDPEFACALDILEKYREEDMAEEVEKKMEEKKG